VTVTLTQLNNALATMVAAGFNTKDMAEQRAAVGRVVIGIIEAARFKDVEDHVVAGTQITDRNWPNHADQAAVMIQAP
jgi:Ribosome inactivating protein